ALAKTLKANRGGGSSTATLPSAEEVAEFARKFAAKPAWMPEWQWQRVDELRDLSRIRRTDEPFFYNFVPEFVIDRLRTLGKPPRQPSNFDAFAAWIDSIIGRQPRGWSGFEPASEMAQWFVYGSALHQPAREAFKRYWTAWLMPKRKSAPAARQLDRNLLDGSLVHTQADQLSRVPDEGIQDTYYARTGDWQGNKSFYRAGFNLTRSTQALNHTAAVGALLGGTIIGAKNAIADGLFGWENYPLRLWSWSRGF